MAEARAAHLSLVTTSPEGGLKRQSDLQRRPDRQENPALLYLKNLRSARSRQTMIGHLRNVARLMGYLFEDGEPPQAFLLRVQWHQINYQAVARLIASEAERSNYQDAQKGQLSPATINCLRAALRGVAREAWLLKQISAEDYHLICEVKPVRGERVEAGRQLERWEQIALFEICARDLTAAGRRDAALIALCFGPGLRRAEVVKLTLADYTAREGKLKVHGKGNKQRWAYLDAGAMTALEEWLRVRGTAPGPLLCPVRKNGKFALVGMSDQVVYKVFQKRAGQARLEKITPHDSRRTMASDLFEAGADIALVQKMMGHSQVSTTAKYDRRGAKAVQKAAQLRRLPFKNRTD